MIVLVLLVVRSAAEYSINAALAVVVAIVILVMIIALGVLITITIKSIKHLLIACMMPGQRKPTKPCGTGNVKENVHRQEVYQAHQKHSTKRLKTQMGVHPAQERST